MNVAAYYNEIEPAAAETLRELIKADLIAPGEVDERSIVDVKADDLGGYTQCHFFAGIGIWSAAFRLAGWPDSRPVWSGSCPCQDFSVAGKGQGTMGERDLWSDMYRLVRECRPERVFGEQVENAIGFAWLDRLSADLEKEAYTVGSVVLGAHSAGSDNIRQRLWWVANSKSAGDSGRLADMQREGSQGRAGNERDRNEPGRLGTIEAGSVAAGCSFNLWRESRWHQCRDGKSRRVPIEPRLFPLADARTHKSYRVAALRQAGNAINIGTAAAFITATEGPVE